MLKRALILLVLLTMAASPAFAYVQPGAFVGGAEMANAILSGPGGYRASRGTHPQIEIDRSPSLIPLQEDQEGGAEPVPEPGTMAMASMGLMALGATLRRRRGR
jgi:uncharacterized protein (TIGR03382 family)